MCPIIDRIAFCAEMFSPFANADNASAAIVVMFAKEGENVFALCCCKGFITKAFVLSHCAVCEVHNLSVRTLRTVDSIKEF